jgi:hypothetical protein
MACARVKFTFTKHRCEDNIKMVVRNVCGINSLDNGYAPVEGSSNGPLNLTKSRGCV